jgi:hypothetical protein
VPTAIVNQSRAMTPTLFANFHDEAQTMAKISHSEEHSGHKYYAPEPPALHYLRSAYSNLIGPQVLISATLLPTLVEPLWGLVVGAGVAGRHLDGQHLDGHRVHDVRSSECEYYSLSNAKHT